MASHSLSTCMTSMGFTEAFVSAIEAKDHTLLGKPSRLRSSKEAVGSSMLRVQTKTSQPSRLQSTNEVPASLGHEHSANREWKCCSTVGHGNFWDYNCLCSSMVVTEGHVKLTVQSQM